MDPRALPKQPGDDLGLAHRGHERIDSTDSQATAVDDAAVLDGALRRFSKRAVDDDEDEVVPAGKRFRVTPGTAAAPLAATKSGSPTAAVPQTVSCFTAAALAVVADPNDDIDKEPGKACISDAARLNVPANVASAAQPDVSSITVAKDVDAADLAAQHEHHKKEPDEISKDAAAQLDVRAATPSAEDPAALAAARIARANAFVTVSKKIDAAALAALHDSQRQWAEERADLERRALCLLHVKSDAELPPHPVYPKDLPPPITAPAFMSELVYTAAPPPLHPRIERLRSKMQYHRKTARRYGACLKCGFAGPSCLDGYDAEDEKPDWQ
ncbi:hypothetical protein AURDEDRAFT_124156 [Auricularia subglabra TFB-10046 SS5]|nr:hypothetical protein AURDEDRAFT_124156 [Auricularia subglabra TFB-10046 SS5]